MLLPHGLRRSRRVGLGGKFSPPFAHVGGVEGGPPSTGMSACVKGEKLSRVRLAVGEAEGYSQHGGIGGVLPHAAPRCGIVALGGGPEPTVLRPCEKRPRRRPPVGHTTAQTGEAGWRSASYGRA